MQNQPARKVDHFAGFDGLRLIAAVSVIFSHSFLIATGTEKDEPLVRMLDRGNSLGLYGVFAFFIISGFLLAHSLRSNPSITRFAVNRALRIMPAFAVCVLFTSFVIGPFCSAVSLKSYFSSSETWSFIRFSLNGFGDWPLPGVFASDGHLSHVVNGSLWSLGYEALSYIFLMAVWMSCRSATPATAVVVAIGLGTWAIPGVKANLVGIAYTLPYFAGGVLMQWVFARFGTNLALAVFSAAALVVACVLHLQAYAFALFGAYLVIFFGGHQNPGSRLATKIGDCSYGLYLYGWPAGQIVKQFTGTTSPFRLFLISLPLAWTLAFLSCHLVERPAMKLRRPLAAKLSATFSNLFKGALAPAIIGGKFAFVAGAVVILTIGHWWLILQSVVELSLAMFGGALLAILVHRLGVRSGLWQVHSSHQIATAACPDRASELRPDQLPGDRV